MRVGSLRIVLWWTLLFAYGAPASAQSIWYVNGSCGDDSWTGGSPACIPPIGPKRTIRAAMDAALTGDEVILADGVYRGNGNKWLSFPGQYFTVRSENGPASCIIDLEDSGLAFFLVADETPQAVVQGLTIENGRNSDGGAFFIHHASQVVIRDCVLRNNLSTSSGGAIHCDTNASPTILDCAIVGNTAIGWGGGLAFFTGGGTPRILGCLVAGNSAGFEGGGFFYSGFGGGPEVVNTTIADNSTGGQVGGIFVDAGNTVLIANSVLWHNDGAPLGGPGSPLATSSNVEGGWPGLGNIDADPLFFAGFYRLGHGSPSIDAGDNGSVPSELLLDLAGRRRILDGDHDGLAVVDQGAFEFFVPRVLRR